MKIFHFFLLGTLSILSSASYSLAATILVPTDHATIQEAITASAHGDLILVDNGTYDENLDFLGKAIIVRSINGAASTIIQATGTVVIFYKGEGPGSILDGFTIQNGGRGIYCINTSPTITNCIIRNNAVSGININQGAPKISYCTITNNSANYGGGIYCQSAVLANSCSPTITNSTITGNTATGNDGRGGGIYGNYYSSITLKDSIISNNEVTNRDGGGIYFAGDSLDISGSSITGNTAGRYGGGIYAIVNTGASTNANLTINKSTISSNTSGSHGGGIYSNGNAPSLTNTLVVKNTATLRGGGIYTNGLIVLNCTIADNTALDSSTSTPGGGIYASASYPITITNSILYGNRTSTWYNQFYPAVIQENFPNISITYNNINQVLAGLGDVYPGEGNINSNPFFIDPIGGDYHLWPSYSPGKPSVDSGTCDGAPTDDLEGISRPSRYGIDMGAYEVSPCLPDGDGDGYSLSPGCGTDVDCDDSDPNRHPGKTEICGDGIDNNCDEAIDNQDDDCLFGCTTGTTESCYVPKSGVCSAGTRSCVGGYWEDCVQDVLPSKEIIDGLDNDCNGLVDESFPAQACGTKNTGVFPFMMLLLGD